MKKFENLFKQVAILDDFLETFEKESIGVGVLMTPVMIVDDEIKHSGSVPNVEKIEEWLNNIKE